MAGCLYQLKFPSGKSYIGVTKRSIEVRWAYHKGYAKGYKQTSESRARISNALKGRVSPTKGKPSKNKGKKIPKISEAITKVTPDILRRMLELRIAGVRLNDIANEVGLSWRTTQRYCSEIKFTREEVARLVWETRRK